ncbi:unnamed protein product [Cylicocyclus nassatus]|uniref:Uncharacterized protein n=1 Tax=Cylicocyclus nassatus TaxID=53992 RepID=A0AA36GVV9_CYLNA|nr:unnamed protein product [Cylicocyclus nassatus]
MLLLQEEPREQLWQGIPRDNGHNKALCTVLDERDTVRSWTSKLRGTLGHACRELGKIEGRLKFGSVPGVTTLDRTKYWTDNSMVDFFNWASDEQNNNGFQLGTYVS